MFSIQVPLNAKDLPAQMGAMRDCLDANGIEAAGFSYRMYLLNGARHFLGLTRNLIRRTNFYLIKPRACPMMRVAFDQTP